MITHRTTFVFYDDDLDIPKLELDMKNSLGNQGKIVHKIDETTGDILQSFEWNDNTEAFVPITASREEIRISRRMRIWYAKQKPFRFNTELVSNERTIICDSLETTFLWRSELSENEKSDIALVRKKSTHKIKLDAQLVRAGLPKETIIKKTNGVEKFFSKAILESK